MQKQFWWIQNLGWLGYLIVVYIAVVAPAHEDGRLIKELSHLFIETWFGYLSSLVIWLFIIARSNIGTKRLIAYCLLLAIAISFIFNFIKLLFYKVIFGWSVVFSPNFWQSWSWQEFGGWYLFSLTTLLVWTAFYFVLIYNFRLEREQKKLLIAEASADKLKLKMLRYQLNPHFMFNSMNAISSLILKKQNDDANEMLEKLCDFFRYTLNEESLINDTIRNEVKLVQLYIDIEKVRFKKRLVYKENVSNETLSAIVPCFLLQPLIENSVKYAVSKNNLGGTISLSIHKRGDCLEIVVCDDGPSKLTTDSGNSKSLGIGLSNIKERLEQLYGKSYRLNMSKNGELGTKIELIIPYEVSSE